MKSRVQSSAWESDEDRIQHPFIQTYTQIPQGNAWLKRYAGRRPVFACILGFTETGLIPNISAAGKTPAERQYTAIADAEFLYNGPQSHPCYPLPPLQMGVSPTFISRAVLANQSIPIHLFNAGLPVAPTVPAIDLNGQAAQCVSTGQSLPLGKVIHLFQQGLVWGEKLALASSSYVILAECVVGGTTTALAVLTALGIAAKDKVNSSHPLCNHAQKWAVVQQGFNRNGWTINSTSGRFSSPNQPTNPFEIVGAVGDPMQIVVAGMAIAASRVEGVLLAGGTQMLAVYALARALVAHLNVPWKPENVVVGTTRWVAEDSTGDTIELAKVIGDVPLLATPLSFRTAHFTQLRAYEEGFVKEGVGAGGCAIAASLYQNWGQVELLQAIEALIEHQQQLT